MSLLEVKNLNRRFGGLRAVNDVSFCIEAGTIKGLIGPNGAGKTTLFNLISGALKPDSGTITFNGLPIHHLAPHAVARHGILRTFQNIKLFAKMSALENVMAGMHIRSTANFAAGMIGLPKSRKEEKQVRDRSMALLAMLGIEHLAEVNAQSCAFGQQRQIELARALAGEPVLLLLDEPAAGLNMHETALLGETIRKIRDRGVTVLLVEHDMSLVMNVSDEINVLSFGKMIAEGKPRDVQKNPLVVRVYLGDDHA
jgi:branched-chain amino acid transport system ATP-binding protein